MCSARPHTYWDPRYEYVVDHSVQQYASPEAEHQKKEQQVALQQYRSFLLSVLEKELRFVLVMLSDKGSVQEKSWEHDKDGNTHSLASNASVRAFGERWYSFAEFLATAYARVWGAAFANAGAAVSTAAGSFAVPQVSSVAELLFEAALWPKGVVLRSFHGVGGEDTDEEGRTSSDDDPVCPVVAGFFAGLADPSSSDSFSLVFEVARALIGFSDDVGGAPEEEDPQEGGDKDNMMLSRGRAALLKAVYSGLDTAFLQRLRGDEDAQFRRLRFALDAITKDDVVDKSSKTSPDVLVKKVLITRILPHLLREMPSQMLGVLRRDAISDAFLRDAISKLGLRIKNFALRCLGVATGFVGGRSDDREVLETCFGLLLMRVDEEEDKGPQLLFGTSALKAAVFPWLRRPSQKFMVFVRTNFVSNSTSTLSISFVNVVSWSSSTTSPTRGPIGAYTSYT